MSRLLPNPPRLAAPPPQREQTERPPNRHNTLIPITPPTRCPVPLPSPSTMPPPSRTLATAERVESLDMLDVAATYRCPVAHSNRGLIYLAMNEVENSASEFRAAIAVEKKHPPILNNFGVVLERLGR